MSKWKMFDGKQVVLQLSAGNAWVVVRNENGNPATMGAADENGNMKWAHFPFIIGKLRVHDNLLVIEYEDTSSNSIMVAAVNGNCVLSVSIVKEQRKIEVVGGIN